MKEIALAFLLCSGIALPQTSLAAETRPSALRFLEDKPVLEWKHRGDVPPCVIRELRRWYERPFVLVDRPKEFPKLTDIRRAGDGRFCMLFLAKVGGSAYVLCFRDYASIGTADRAVIFRITRRGCVFTEDYALEATPKSFAELHAALKRSTHQ